MSYGTLGGSGGSTSLLDQLQDALFALGSVLPCCGPRSGHGERLGSIGGDGGGGGASGSVKLNGRTLQLVRLLGEGGFSFVYLARDRASGREFALKQMRCPSGTPTLRLALSEIETTRRFRSPNVIRLLDSAVEQGPDGHVVYLFLPLFPAGNIQDAINARAVRNETANERECLVLLRGAAKGLEAMHRYRLPNVGAKTRASEAPARPSQGAAEDDEHHAAEQEEDDDETRLIHAHSGADGGVEEEEEHEDGAYPPRPRAAAAQEEQGSAGELCPWAHRDIKPGNIMISRPSDGASEPLAVLMDFGSALRARIHIKSRREAVMQQDVAAEHSSMAFRAPELFDVKTDETLDEKVDIWSLGCTLFAMLYGYSPFETPQLVEQGGSVAMAVQSASWKVPEAARGVFSEATIDIIRRCLVLNPRERADIEEVLAATEKALSGLA